MRGEEENEGYKDEEVREKGDKDVSEEGEEKN